MQLCQEVIDAYKHIYDEEERTTQLPVESRAQRNPGFCRRRAHTDGTYGIWGYDLGDLLLRSFYYDPKTSVLRIIVFPSERVTV